MTEQQKQEFETVARPLIAWLNENCHPHTNVVVCQTGAELHEGIFGIKTLDYIKD